MEEGDDDGKGTSRSTKQHNVVVNSRSVVAGKITSSEEDEDVEVTWTTYSKMFKPGGGCCTILIIQLAMLCFVFCNIAASYFLQKWAYSDEEEQSDRFVFFTIVIMGFSIGMGIFIFIRVALFVCAGLRSSKALHNSLIANVYQAPINLYFDKTPIGKILNRFSKDLAIVDEQIWFDCGSFLAQFY